MRKFFLFAAIGFSPLYSEKLPILTDEPFLGFWIGHVADEFEFAVGTEGDAQFYLKEKVEREMVRLSTFQTFKFTYLVEEKRGDDWITRSVEPDGFETTQAAATGLEEVSWTALYKGGTRIAVTHRFGEEGVDTQMAVVSSESENPIRVGLEVSLPSLYRIRSAADERDARRKVRGDRIEIVDVKGEEHRFKLSDDIKLGSEEHFADGALSYSIDSAKLADKTVTLSNETENGGVIYFEQPAALYQRHMARWYPAKEDAVFRIAVE